MLIVIANLAFLDIAEVNTIGSKSMTFLLKPVLYTGVIKDSLNIYRIIPFLKLKFTKYVIEFKT